MVEDGFNRYVQAGLANQLLIVPGGFAAELPPNQIGTQSGQSAQAWLYRSILSHPTYNLSGWEGWTEWTVEVQAHGTSMALAIQLARAIDNVLRGGFQGNFADSDATHVFGIFRLPTQVDGYSDANRSFVRSLEYTIQYEQI